MKLLTTHISSLQASGGNRTQSTNNWQSRSVLPPIPVENTPPQRQHNATSKPALPPISHLTDSQNSVQHTPRQQENHRAAPKQVQSIQQHSPTTDKPHVNHSNVSDQALHKPHDGVTGHSEYEPKSYDNHRGPKEHQWKPAAGYSYLPTQPITLSRDQEAFLLRKLAADLTGCTLVQVKSVYQEMAGKDHQLSGWGSYAELGLALQKHGVSGGQI